MERLTFDYSYCMDEMIGAKGLSSYLLEAVRLPLESIHGRLQESREAGSLAWMDLPRRNPTDIVGYAESVYGRFDTLVVLGIGGSALGTTALSTALHPPFYNLLPSRERGGHPRLFVVDNVDPDEVTALLSHLDLDTTLINVVSKSGTTAETMAVYLIVRELLEEQLGRPRLREHLVFTTDPYTGVLREIGSSEGITMFDVPQGVGGRFSVLSPVGLLPAALTGLDITELLDGAWLMDEWMAEADVLRNPAYVYATIQFLMDTNFHRRISVMMPYSYRLGDIADWYRQLWAESLGKAVDRQGRRAETGPTPVKALGATDQHSQVQLYSEGPDDKIITFLRVEEFGRDAVIPDVHPDHESLSYLAGHSLSKLLNAEQEATAWALARRSRPSLTISVPRVDAGAVGQILFMLQSATAVAGELYDVNAFDQPGVELGKDAAYSLMGRRGYEERADEIRKDIGTAEEAGYTLGGPREA